MSSALLWLLPIALPLAASGALLARRTPAALVPLAPLSAVPALLLALLPAPAAAELPWLLLGSRLGLDALSRPLLALTATLWLLAGLYACGYFSADRERRRFLCFFLPAMSGNLGLILAQDMPLFYCCFALMSVASYGLIVFTGERTALQAGRVYIAMVFLGEVLLFTGLVMAAWIGDSALWSDVAATLPGADAGRLAAALLMVGFAVKAGALPLHVWLPLAHPAAPVPASAVLSGAMIKAGLLGWLRVAPAAAGAWEGWITLALVLGISAAFWGVAVGLGQRNPKTVLAYSSLSQMGLITVALALGMSAATAAAYTPVLLYAAHHGLAKGALFLGVGIAPAPGAGPWPRRLRALGLLLPALVLAGLPLSSGALAKAALKTGLPAAPAPWPQALGLLLPVAALGTTLLMARFLWLLWQQPGAGRAATPAIAWLAWGALLALVALAVLLWPWPASGDALRYAHSLPGLLQTLWPLLAGSAISALCAARGAWERRRGR